MQGEKSVKVRDLDAILSQKYEIDWKRKEVWKQGNNKVPHIGDCRPLMKVIEYYGNFNDGDQIKVTKCSLIFFSAYTLLGLDRDYDGPWDWLSVEIGKKPNENLYSTYGLDDRYYKEVYKKINELYRSAKHNYKRQHPRFRISIRRL